MKKKVISNINKRSSDKKYLAEAYRYTQKQLREVRSDFIYKAEQLSNISDVDYYKFVKKPIKDFYAYLKECKPQRRSNMQTGIKKRSLSESNPLESSKQQIKRKSGKTSLLRKDAEPILYNPRSYMDYNDLTRLTTEFIVAIELNTEKDNDIMEALKLANFIFIHQDKSFSYKKIRQCLTLALEANGWMKIGLNLEDTVSPRGLYGKITFTKRRQKLLQRDVPEENIEMIREWIKIAQLFTYHHQTARYGSKDEADFIIHTSIVNIATNCSQEQNQPIDQDRPIISYKSLENLLSDD